MAVLRGKPKAAPAVTPSRTCRHAASSSRRPRLALECGPSPTAALFEALALEAPESGDAQEYLGVLAARRDDGEAALRREEILSGLDAPVSLGVTPTRRPALPRYRTPDLSRWRRHLTRD